MIERAREFATKAHEGQTRWDKTTPYITHPQAVANAVDDEAKPVAWLHDVLEDCPVDAGHLLAAGFTPEIVTAVEAMTKHQGEDYGEYLIRVAANPIARRVKIADIGHNLEGSLSPKRKDKYLRALKFLGEYHA